MGKLRGNPWYGLWDESENDGYHDSHPIPKPALDKRKEDEFEERYKSGEVITYYVDPELLKQGIFKKVEK